MLELASLSRDHLSASLSRGRGGQGMVRKLQSEDSEAGLAVMTGVLPSQSEDPRETLLVHSGSQSLNLQNGSDVPSPWGQCFKG